MLACHQEIKPVVKFSPYLKHPSSVGVYFLRDNVNCRTTEIFVSANISMFCVSQEPVRLSFSLLFWAHSEQIGDMDQGPLEQKRNSNTLFSVGKCSHLWGPAGQRGTAFFSLFFFFILVLRNFEVKL